MDEKKENSLELLKPRIFLMLPTFRSFHSVDNVSRVDTAVFMDLNYEL